MERLGRVVAVVEGVDSVDLSYSVCASCGNSSCDNCGDGARRPAFALKLLVSVQDKVHRVLLFDSDARRLVGVEAEALEKYTEGQVRISILGTVFSCSFKPRKPGYNRGQIINVHEVFTSCPAADSV